MTEQKLAKDLLSVSNEPKADEMYGAQNETYIED